MSTAPDPCDPARLRRILEDRLGEPDQAELAGHLERCEPCRIALEELAAGSRWWGEVRQLAGGAEPPGRFEPAGAPGEDLGFLGPS